MRELRGKLMVVGGVVVAMLALVAFSVISPVTTMGGGTDVGLPTDVEPPDGEKPTIHLTAADTAPAVGESVVLSVEVVDDEGSPVADTECTFVILSQPGEDACVDEGPAMTDSEGQVSTTLYVGSTPGTIEVEAQCGGATAAVSVVAGAVEAPASLPQAGSGAELGTGGSAGAMLALLLAALGLTLTGAGVIAARRGR